jgi:integrase
VERLIAHNPADGCTLPKQEHREMKTLPLDQLDAFFTEAHNSGVFEQYYTEMATGLRRGELLGLKWEDIDFDLLTISVRRQILRLNGEVQEAPLKTKNSYRTISISRELADILRDKQTREQGKSDYVFSSPSGGAISPDSVLHMLHRVLKRAGLEKIRYHDLRHTFATLALQNGVDIKTLSGMLGHYSAGFTLDTYAHVTTTMQRDAADKVGGFLRQSVITPIASQTAVSGGSKFAPQ